MKKRINLNLSEKAIERAVSRGEFRPASKEEFEKIAGAVARRKKDAVLNIRVNSQDLASIKAKARRMGIPYQSFVSELIHQYAT
ncbi:MAG TPA: antitoxin [Elusimicrobia bacterium]|nr:antitoxin [Elusimicrobiota bacterium]HBT62048.1 antitoxin [Elusimicrobiota bacterium]